MEKQITVIKCPQCGNTKPVHIGGKHYKCDKCETEFFVDGNDIGLNRDIKSFLFDDDTDKIYSKPPVINKEPKKNKKTGCFIFLFIFIIIGIIFSVKRCSDLAKEKNIKTEQSIIEFRKCYASTLFNVNGKGVAFYIADFSYDSIFAIFIDIESKKIIKKECLSSTPIDYNHEILLHRFSSDSTNYLIINDNLIKKGKIYKIDLNNYAIIDITSKICMSKPALNAGIKYASFVPKNKGEGFKLKTNLGKELFYFPKLNELYTEKAFEYLSDDNSNKNLSSAKDITYYLFQNKESAHSSNVAQLMKIVYKFNNGGPENKMLKISNTNIKNLNRYRITSLVPITEERVYFSPSVLYSDNKNILISYKPSLESGIPLNLQLLDINGKIIWTTPLNKVIDIFYAVRTNNSFMIQTDEGFFGISFDGKSKKEFNFIKVEDYKIEEIEIEKVWE